MPAYDCPGPKFDSRFNPINNSLPVHTTQYNDEMTSPNPGDPPNDITDENTDNQILAAIHALLAAMAIKQNKNSIPSSQVENTKTLLQQAHRSQISTTDGINSPKRGPRYESAKTINYQLQQRPTEKTCSSPEWDGVFHPFPAARPDVARRDHSPGNAGDGLVSVLSWTVPQAANLNGAYLRYDESGYDGDGYVCGLRRRGDVVVGDGGAGLTRLGERPPPLERNDREIEEFMVGLTDPELMPLCSPPG